VAPQDWLVADGSEVSRSMYAELFQAIGTTYGSGNGSTTFTLPDLRGRVVVAVGSNSDVAGLGRNEGNAEESRSPLHQHSLPAHSHGLGTLALESAGGHFHTLASLGSDFTTVARCVASCDAAYPNITIRTPTAPTGGITNSAGAHTHGITGRVGAVPGDVDGDVEMASGKGGPSYLALTYIVRAR
jgi:microcystin-dependent protein